MTKDDDGTPASSELKWFRRACWVYASVPIVLGSSIALSGGAGLQRWFGFDLANPDPSLESALHFLAANFAAMGLVLVWATRDVVPRRAAMRIVFGAMVVGATLRLMSIAVHGVPSMMTMAVIGGELSAGGLWLWHTRVLRQLHRANAVP